MSGLKEPLTGLLIWGSDRVIALLVFLLWQRLICAAPAWVSESDSFRPPESGGRRRVGAGRGRLLIRRRPRTVRKPGLGEAVLRRPVCRPAHSTSTASAGTASLRDLHGAQGEADSQGAEDCRRKSIDVRLCLHVEPRRFMNSCSRVL